MLAQNRPFRAISLNSVLIAQQTVLAFHPVQDQKPLIFILGPLLYVRN